MNQHDQSKKKTHGNQKRRTKIIVTTLALLLATSLVVNFFLLSELKQQKLKLSANTNLSSISPAPQATQTFTPTKEDTGSARGTIENTTIEIQEAMFKTENSDDYIVILYQWSHSSESAMCFVDMPVNVRVYQDGVELELSFIEGLEHDTFLTNVKAGGKLKTQCAYALRNSKSDVEVEITDIYGEEQGKIYRSFKMNNLQ